LDKFFDNPEEIMIGMLLQLPLYFITGWMVLPVMLACGIMWRLGGWAKGHKLWRRLGVPFVVCISAANTTNSMYLFLAVPFMVWLAPSYGKKSWLFRHMGDDFLTRLVCFAWYWGAFAIVYIGVKLWT
jgi:hypothetical protein